MTLKGTSFQTGKVVDQDEEALGEVYSIGTFPTLIRSMLARPQGHTNTVSPKICPVAPPPTPACPLLLAQNTKAQARHAGRQHSHAQQADSSSHEGMDPPLPLRINATRILFNPRV